MYNISFVGKDTYIYEFCNYLFDKCCQIVAEFLFVFLK